MYFKAGQGRRGRADGNSHQPGALGHADARDWPDVPGGNRSQPTQSRKTRSASRDTAGSGQRAPVRQPRHGVITRWNPGDTYGFVTSSDGVSWFVSRDSLPDGRAELPEGTAVTFGGSPKPKFGKAYPGALRVRIAAG
jgi:cold shock CspA family protein